MLYLAETASRFYGGCAAAQAASALPLRYNTPEARAFAAKRAGRGERRGENMKIAYIGIDLMLPVLDAALGCGMELMELFTCRTDNVTEFNSGVIARAKALGAPYTLERITSADLERCAAAGCEAALCAGYYYLVPTGGPLPLINFHPAPLPERRGGWPMPVMLLRGDRLGAMTAHLMSARFDEGDILLREDFEIAPGETLESYMRRANALAPGMVRRIAEDLPGVLAGARPQGRGEYIAMPTERDWTVTPDMAPEEADRILRAFYGYECVYAGAEKLELIRARAYPGPGPERSLPLAGGHIEYAAARRLPG